MKNQDKLLFQVVACLAIFAMARCATMLGGDSIAHIRDAVKMQVEKNYTAEDIKDAGSQLTFQILDAPKKFSKVVTAANEIGEYATPIDKDSKSNPMTVHAAAGGKVSYSGIDRDLGMCVKVQHKDKISIYGNLYTLTVVTGERIKKGDIIGTFDKKGAKEFYYQLDNSVV